VVISGARTAVGFKAFLLLSLLETVVPPLVYVSLIDKLISITSQYGKGRRTAADGAAPNWGVGPRATALRALSDRAHIAFCSVVRL